MSPRAWDDRIRDILEAIDEIARFTEGQTLAEFAADARTIKAVLADFSIIGEAARHVPDEVRAIDPSIPWDLMNAMRNKIVHIYFGIEPGIVWQTIRNDLPELRRKLQALLDGRAGT